MMSVARRLSRGAAGFRHARRPLIARWTVCESAPEGRQRGPPLRASVFFSLGRDSVRRPCLPTHAQGQGAVNSGGDGRWRSSPPRQDVAPATGGGLPNGSDGGGGSVDGSSSGGSSGCSAIGAAASRSRRGPLADGGPPRVGGTPRPQSPAASTATQARGADRGAAPRATPPPPPHPPSPPPSRAALNTQEPQTPARLADIPPAGAAAGRRAGTV